jgi:hypothetical protein
VRVSIRAKTRAMEEAVAYDAADQAARERLGALMATSFGLPSSRFRRPTMQYERQRLPCPPFVQQRQSECRTSTLVDRPIAAVCHQDIDFREQPLHRQIARQPRIIRNVMRNCIDWPAARANHDKYIRLAACKIA